MQDRTNSEKVELAAQIGSMILGTLVSAMQIVRMVRQKHE